MFNSVQAVDEIELYNIELVDLEDEELKKILLPSNFCLISSDGHTYGPFGSDLLGRKPVTIQIGNGNVLDQATSSFLYDYGSEIVKNDKCFSFYVSNEMIISGVADVSRVKTIEIQ